MVYYPKPMHKQEVFANLRLNEEEYSVTNRLCKLVLELPMHPYMEEADVDAIVKKIADFLNNR